MQIFYLTEKLRKEFEDARSLQRHRGTVQAEKIKTRLAQFDAAEHWAELKLLPGHHHELAADKAGQLACDLNGNYRLIYEPWPQPAPQLASGGLDGSAVTAIRIHGVLDYHERKNKKPI
jgi:proteic killer suppression protein